MHVNEMKNKMPLRSTRKINRAVVIGDRKPRKIPKIIRREGHSYTVDVVSHCLFIFTHPRILCVRGKQGRTTLNSSVSISKFIFFLDGIWYKARRFACLSLFHSPSQSGSLWLLHGLSL